MQFLCRDRCHGLILVDRPGNPNDEYTARPREIPSFFASPACRPRGATAVDLSAVGCAAFNCPTRSASVTYCGGARCSERHCSCDGYTGGVGPSQWQPQCGGATTWQPRPFQNQPPPQHEATEQPGLSPARYSRLAAQPPMTSATIIAVRKNAMADQYHEGRPRPRATARSADSRSSGRRLATGEKRCPLCPGEPVVGAPRSRRGWPC